MSWRRVSSVPGVSVTVQRWWSSAASPAAGAGVTHPARGIVHSAVLLERLLAQTDAKNIDNTTTTTTLVPPRTTVAQLTQIDWVNLFQAGVLDPACGGEGVGCFTFLVADWHLFAEAQAANEKQRLEGKTSSLLSTPPFPIFSVVRRRADDFAYNNHLYEALRRSSDWNDIFSAACDRAVDTGGKGPSMVKAASDFDEHQESHKNCSLIGSGSSAALAPCNAENMAVADFLSKAASFDEVKQLTSVAVNFFPHRVPASSVCWQNRSFFVIVNLKPVEKAGHLLIIPKHICGTLYDALTSGSNEEEQAAVAQDLAEAITRTIRALDARQRAVAKKESDTNNSSNDGGGCDGYSLVVQQGKHGGQTVGCLHVHVIAMVRGESFLLAGGSVVVDPDTDPRSAEELEAEEAELRKPRTAEMMEEEARELREKWFCCVSENM